jgi:phosphatidylglycerol lysyltransferase
MSARLIRQALAIPAPFVRGPDLALDTLWLQPDERRLSLAHPSGWLAHDALLNSYRCERGQVHYALSGRTVFAVGAEGLEPELLAEWARCMGANGARRQLVFPLASWQIDSLVQKGFETMKVGEEAEVFLPTYDLQGPRLSNLRRMLRRADAGGLTVILSDHLPPQAHRLEQSWRAQAKQVRRMGLLVGADQAANQDIFALVRDAEDRLVAWVQARPGFDGGGFGIDNMVRHPDAPPGAIELAINSLLKARRQAGDRWFSLGAVPLRGVRFERPLLGPICIALRETKLGNSLFSFSGLSAFKDKFSPRWRCVFIADYHRLNALSLYEGCRLWGLF